MFKKNTTMEAHQEPYELRISEKSVKPQTRSSWFQIKTREDSNYNGSYYYDFISESPLSVIRKVQIRSVNFKGGDFHFF